jgi:hypothetical protein
MSISSLMAYLWPQPGAAQTDATAAGENATTPPAETGTAAPANPTAPTPAQNTSGTGTSDLFQQLASDIQAVLLQGQDSTTTPISGTNTASASAATSTSSGTDPADQLASDIQAIYAQSQSNQTTSTNPQQVNLGQPDQTGQVQPHHHHHHHGGATEASAGATGDSTTSSSTAASGSGVPGNIQNASQILEADILQALQSNGSTTPSTNNPGVTA